MIPSVNLPDLRQIIPEYYRNEGHCVVFQAQRDDDFNLLERLITQYHYYDRPGVWGSRVDTDKKVTAALVSGLSASSCLEIGCFTGPVLSLLEEMGLDVAGIETSHLAFSLAYPNILNRMTFGDLLSVPIAHLYDVVLAMDVLEHLNPVKLGGYIDKIASTLSQDGYAVVNSPMFGVDDVFGSVFPAYLKEWRSIGDTAFWRDLDCDGLGWPKLGHLVWASPRWWERMFAERGLFRDRGIEAAVQGRLKTFFVKAPGRRCLFILRREDNRRQSADVARSVMSAIDALPW
jgi:SAM-dependent methyltransferase